MVSTVPSRFLPMTGSLNFRDFGGYPTADGRQVKWRQLFRCGALSMLTEADHVLFERLNIGVICDLRRVDEAAGNPSPQHPPFDVRLAIPIAPGSNDMLRQSIQDTSQSAEDRIRYMTEVTRDLARDHHAEYRVLFEQLLNTPAGFLLHCSAGKDRTGFGAALILAALGVEQKLIMEDYLLTNQAACLREFMQTKMQVFYGAHFDAASLAAVGGVRSGYLQAAFDEMIKNHDSLDGYLEEIGVDSAAKRALRTKLLV